jgi:hypothetical protein
VKIAFVYKTNDTIAASWEVGSIQVSGYGPVLSKSAPVYNYYLFNGTKWVYYRGSLTIQPDEYTQFGGPATSHAFSSTYPAANYLPQYLGTLYPYAQSGDTILISYKNNASRIAERYEYNTSSTTGLLNWSAYNTIKTKTDQFIQIGDKWVFDPTVRVTMGALQMMIIVYYVKNYIDASYVDSYGTAEFYYGASAYYKNFDLRLSKRIDNEFKGLSEAEGIALTWKRLEEALLKYLEVQFPDAVPQVKGITVYYWLTFSTYENDYSKNTYSGCFRYTDEDGFIRDTEEEDRASAAGELENSVLWNR